MHETAAAILGLILGYVGWMAVFRLAGPLARIIVGGWHPRARLFHGITLLLCFLFLFIVLLLLLITTSKLLTSTSVDEGALRRITVFWSIMGLLLCGLIGKVETVVRQRANSH
jgi:hypothetical protein